MYYRCYKCMQRFPKLLQSEDAKSDLLQCPGCGWVIGKGEVELMHRAEESASAVTPPKAEPKRAVQLSLFDRKVVHAYIAEALGETFWPRSKT